MAKRQKCPFILDEAEEVPGSQSGVESSEEEEIDIGGTTPPLSQDTNGERETVGEDESSAEEEEEEEDSEVSSVESGSDVEVIPETPPVSDDEVFPGLNTFTLFV
jgi:hypothetical protein